MARPLIISDCDEVLLHFIPHFKDWLSEAHDIDLNVTGEDLTGAMRVRASGEPVAASRFMPILDAFFASEMPRQTPIEGAREALARLSARADIVILTNLTDARRDARQAQLERLGFSYPVVTNQGPKGAAAKRLMADHAPSMTVFIDDLGRHIQSVADHAPQSWRLHMVGTPDLAAVIAPAPAAHLRVNDWATALPWLEARLDGGLASPA